jgi:2,3-bisphosphoglycerate-dependent phosphoglycerate mutase
MIHRRIHLVRHGVTIWNRERRFQGHTDVPLSADGEQQAIRTAMLLSELPVTTCFASDLSRAYDTAVPIADALGVPVMPEFDLREACKGQLEGKYRDPDSGLIGDESHYHDENDIDARPPGGESLVDLYDRTSRFLGRLTDADSEIDPGEILLVSHGGTMRTLLAGLLGLDAAAGRSFHFANCSVTTVQLRGDLPPLLVRYNDIQHLNGFGT